MTTLTVRSLGGGYPNSGQVLFDVDLAAQSGGLHAVLGANGAGKTTLLRMLSGALRPSGGAIELDEDDIVRTPVTKRVRRGITLVPQGRALFPDLSVEENLSLGAYTVRRALNERLREVFDLFEVLGRKRKASAGSLSGGEQQMLAVGRGLMANPKVLLLDEPCIGVAPIIRRRIYETVAVLAHEKNLAVVASEQETSLILEVADTFSVLRQGAVVLAGEASTLSHGADELRSAYLGMRV